MRKHCVKHSPTVGVTTNRYELWIRSKYKVSNNTPTGSELHTKHAIQFVLRWIMFQKCPSYSFETSHSDHVRLNRVYSFSYFPISKSIRKVFLVHRNNSSLSIHYQSWCFLGTLMGSCAHRRLVYLLLRKWTDIDDEERNVFRNLNTYVCR